MSHDVFICHAHADINTALAACARLEDANIRCWIAPRDVGAGPYAKQLVQAISTATAVLLVFSNESNASEHVLRELEIASSRQKVIIPFKIEDAVLNEDLEYFTLRVHWLDALNPPLEARLDELVEFVQRLLGARPVSTLPRAADRSKRRERSQKRMPAMILVVLLVAGAGAYLGTKMAGVVTAVRSPRPTAAAAPFVYGATRCATVIADPQPPTNVRHAPNGDILTTLDNGREIVVDDDRAGWLLISSPTTGWVHNSVTAVRCGNAGDVRGTVQAVHALSVRALEDRRAADMLVRYALAANGDPGKAASRGVSDLMRAKPRLLISVLDQIDEPRRRSLLRDTIALNDDRAAVRSFADATALQPSGPTSSTWAALVRSCESRLASILHC